MAISRPILVALVAAVLALVAFYATTGARTSGDEANEPAGAVAERAPAKPESDASSAGPAGSNGRPATRSTAPPRPTHKRDPGAAARRGVPVGVARALQRRRTVVLFFFQRGGADDRATARAVAAVRERGRASVFEAPISRLADYGGLIAGAGVSQAPAVVILRKETARRSQVTPAARAGVSARLVEGFVDEQSLIQQVADAR